VIAALYVHSGGIYFGRKDVEPWDKKRDARAYVGPWPVVAHPPCSRWCQLAYINQKRYGHRVGDDGGCFESALDAVRKFGGVLEHPAFSYAWDHFELPAPPRRGWAREMFPVGVPAGSHVWVCQVSQAAYGHRARKLTWIYYVGNAPPETTDWSRPTPTAQVSFCGNHGNSPLPRLKPLEASATTPRFAEWLIQLAHTARSTKEHD
jgi:hypothetical protein